MSKRIKYPLMSLLTIFLILFLLEFLFTVFEINSSRRVLILGGVGGKVRTFSLLPNPQFNPISRKEERFYIYQPDPIYLWSLKPNFHLSGKNLGLPEQTVSTNSLGFRSREILPQKPKNLIRIVCMGDSITFGWGDNINQEDTYPARLESLLNLNFPQYSFEVINAGCPGYSSFQGYLLLKEKVLKLKPDLLILAYGYNDLTPGEIDFIMSNTSYFINCLHIFLNRFEVYKALKRLLFSLKIALNFSQRDLRIDLNDARAPRVNPEQYSKITADMIKLARENSCQVILLNLVFSEDRYFKISPYMEKLARDHQLIYLDFKKIFDQEMEKGDIYRKYPELTRKIGGKGMDKFFNPKLSLLCDVCHPNLLGYCLIADKLFETLSANQHLFKEPEMKLWREK